MTSVYLRATTYVDRYREILRDLERAKDLSPADHYRWRCAMVRGGRGSELEVFVGDVVAVVVAGGNVWSGRVVEQNDIGAFRINGGLFHFWTAPGPLQIKVIEPRRIDAHR